MGINGKLIRYYISLLTYFQLCYGIKFGFGTSEPGIGPNVKVFVKFKPSDLNPLIRCYKSAYDSLEADDKLQFEGHYSNVVKVLEAFDRLSKLVSESQLQSQFKPTPATSTSFTQTDLVGDIVIFSDVKLYKNESGIRVELDPSKYLATKFEHSDPPDLSLESDLSNQSEHFYDYMFTFNDTDEICEVEHKGQSVWKLPTTQPGQKDKVRLLSLFYRGKENRFVLNLNGLFNSYMFEDNKWEHKPQPDVKLVVGNNLVNLTNYVVWYYGSYGNTLEYEIDSDDKLTELRHDDKEVWKYSSGEHPKKIIYHHDRNEFALQLDSEHLSYKLEDDQWKLTTTPTPDQTQQDCQPSVSEQPKLTETESKPVVLPPKREPKPDMKLPESVTSRQPATLDVMTEKSTEQFTYTKEGLMGGLKCKTYTCKEQFMVNKVVKKGGCCKSDVEIWDSPGDTYPHKIKVLEKEKDKYMAIVMLGSEDFVLLHKPDKGQWTNITDDRYKLDKVVLVDEDGNTMDESKYELDFMGFGYGYKLNDGVKCSSAWYDDKEIFNSGDVVDGENYPDLTGVYLELEFNSFILGFKEGKTKDVDLDTIQSDLAVKQFTEIGQQPSESETEPKTPVELDLESKRSNDQFDYTKKDKVVTYTAKSTFGFNTIKRSATGCSSCCRSGNTIWETDKPQEYGSVVVYDGDNLSISLNNDSIKHYKKDNKKGWEERNNVLELDINSTKGAFEYEYSKPNKIHTYTTRSNFGFSCVKHKKDEIWKTTNPKEYGNKVECDDSHVTVTMKNDFKSHHKKCDGKWVKSEV